MEKVSVGTGDGMDGASEDQNQNPAIRGQSSVPISSLGDHVQYYHNMNESGHTPHLSQTEILHEDHQHASPKRYSRSQEILNRRVPDDTFQQGDYAERQNEERLPRPERDPGASGSKKRHFWEYVLDYWATLKSDFGAPDKNQEHSNFIGDTGIDMQALNRLQQQVISPSAPESSLLLSSRAPGQGASTPHSQSGWESESNTPMTTRRHHDFGVDAADVSRALHKLKEKMGHAGHAKRAKYVQAKSGAAVRRSVVMLLTYCFMLYGAPSHRIEEYVMYLFTVCGLEGQVNYTVGCAEICFTDTPHPSDPTTRYSYTTLVKAQGLDVGALELAFQIYRELIHQKISIEEAEKKLKELIELPAYYKPWLLVLLYGLASALVCVWAFRGFWTDMAVAFLLGSLVGVLQIIVASHNPLYTNVLEVTAAVLTSFGARAFASIGGPSQKYFCFAAVAESSIATILPGYMVLCGALELQSKSITAGSTRLFYAVIYSLFLGYGINVGSQMWAVMYPEAPTSATCPRTIDPRWKILLVPCYLVVQAMLIRSRPIQIPLQVAFGSAAYAVNYFVSKRATAQIADTASAFTLGVLGHLYSRSQHGFAFASIVAGIMVLVPGGIAAQGGLIAGIAVPLFSNGTVDAQEVYSQNLYQSFSVGAQMILVGIGLSVGLLMSALAIYPLGRKNNALFSL